MRRATTARAIPASKAARDAAVAAPNRAPCDPATDARPSRQDDDRPLEPFNLGIGQRLKTVRRKARLRQPDFAARLSLSPRAYANYERGERTIPAQAVKALHDLFQVDPIWLLSGPEYARFLQTPLRPELLVKLIVKVDQHEAQSPQKLSPVQKARLIITLHPYCQARGKVEDKYVENSFLSLIGGSAQD